MKWRQVNGFTGQGTAPLSPVQRYGMTGLPRPRPGI